MPIGRLLVVDDDWAFIENLRLAVDPLVDVHIVSGEDEALAAVRDWEPDVVVLDLLLPDGDGFALLDLLTCPTRADRPVVLCITDGYGADTRLLPLTDWPVGTLVRSASPASFRSAVLQAVAAAQGPVAAH